MSFGSLGFVCVFVLSVAYSESFAAFMCLLGILGRVLRVLGSFLFRVLLSVLYVFGVFRCVSGPQCLLASFAFLLVRFFLYFDSLELLCFFL